MMIVQIFQLVLWEVVIPAIVGTLFSGVDERTKKFPFRWISGQMLLWAVFQIVCVPLILREVDFVYLVRAYAALTAVLLAPAVIILCREMTAQGGRPERKFGIMAPPEKGIMSNGNIFWIIFWCLLLFQLIQAVRMTYGDGDDAFYVAITTITNNANTMYRKLPYTGGSTGLDVRHGLAPFPVWIAFLTEVSGMESAEAAHIAVPLMLIAMTYGIFYLIGEKVFWKKRESIPLFLIFTELLVLFGDYSYYTAENFMIARSRQGKAALGNIMIPMLFFLLLLLLQRLQEEKRISLKYWILLLAVMISACLCSTQGAMLVCMLAGIAGICGAIAYRKWRFLIPMSLCCVPCGVFVLLYLLLE